MFFPFCEYWVPDPPPPKKASAYGNVINKGEIYIHMGYCAYKHHSVDAISDIMDVAFVVYIVCGYGEGGCSCVYHGYAIISYYMCFFYISVFPFVRWENPVLFFVFYISSNWSFWEEIRFLKKNTHFEKRQIAWFYL